MNRLHDIIKAFSNIRKHNKKLELKFLKEKFAYRLMSVPSYSGMEDRMIEFIENWAKTNNVECILDKSRNIYLTKGTVGEGEYYPCVTSHLDTVQKGHINYIEKNKLLPLKTRRSATGKTALYVQDMGIGADDKCGVLVSLSLFDYSDKMKAAFFVSEEAGCIGSKAMDVSFFENVGYVIGWDSPGLNRNAWACAGQKLFDYKFYEKHIKRVCDAYGRTLFHSEPSTDVASIRERLDIVCMNFGSGGYRAHSEKEYAVMEDMDVSVEFGKDLITELGCRRYEFPRDQTDLPLPDATPDVMEDFDKLMGLDSH